MTPPPTVAGFLSFIRNIMGIGTDVLPDDSPVIPVAFTVALNVVNPALKAICVDATAFGGTTDSEYNRAVYNLAGDNLVNYAQDVPDAPNVEGSDPPAPYFKNLRKVWNINGFVPGVVDATSDESTSMSLAVIEAAKNFTLGNLQNLKTPWGRQYLSIAQDFGSIYGIS